MEQGQSRPGSAERFLDICRRRNEWLNSQDNGIGSRSPVSINMIYVILNGESIIEMDMNLWTSAKINPDGNEIPNWLTTPLAQLPTQGRIGFQGKHGNATVYFRNIRIKEID